MGHLIGTKLQRLRDKLYVNVNILYLTQFLSILLNIIPIDFFASVTTRIFLEFSGFKLQSDQK
jgi:hypothetical protein